jgi:nitrous oxidase accessory protein NosD
MQLYKLFPSGSLFGLGTKADGILHDSFSNKHWSAIVVLSMRPFHKSVWISAAAILCGAITTHARPQSSAYNDIREHGAVGDGVTDNCLALQKAASACGQGTILVPAGRFATSCGIALPESCSLLGVNAQSSVLLITASTAAAVSVGDAQHYAENQKIENLTIDANGLAKDGVYLRWFHSYTLRDVWVRNALVNAFHFGDPGLPYPSYGVYVWNSTAYRGKGITIPKGSVGILLDNATDNLVTGSSVVGSETGIRVERGGNIFTNDHVWAFGPGWMSIGFDDNGFNNFWDGVEADTVRQTGLLVRRTGAMTIIRGCRFYNNAQGEDGVAVGIEFLAAKPTATIADNVFLGADASHRLALDVKLSQTANVTMAGNLARNTVRSVSVTAK